VPHRPQPRFGIMTAPSQVDYQDVLRVRREADEVPQIEHAWLYDHLMPIFGDPDGPTFEGWTLLAALAAQTRRVRVGLLETSNRFRPPAMLAKIATTVDIVSGGRLDFGIGVGSAAPCWTATAPTSAVTRPPSPGRCTCRSRTSGPAPPGR